MNILRILLNLLLWSTWFITWFCSLSIKYINNNKFLNNITSDTQLYYKTINDQNIVCYYSDNNYKYQNNYICTHNDPIYNNNNNEIILLKEPLILTIIYYIYIFHMYYIIFNMTSLLLKYLVFGYIFKPSDNKNSPLSILDDKYQAKFTVKKHTDINDTNEFIGCSNIKKEIDKLVNFLTKKELYNTNDCKLSRGLILLGPPGTGKTHIVNQICKLSRYNYIATSGSDFVNKYVGTGSDNVNKLFETAKNNNPCIIFIDEADAILSKRNYNSESGAVSEYNNIICKILELMDSLNTCDNTFVIFASNMPEHKIDPAIKRSGRAELLIKLDYPTFDERKDLFKLYLKNYYNTDINLDRVSKESYGLTGADIKKIINNIHINKVNNYVVNSKPVNHNEITQEQRDIFNNEIREPMPKLIPNALENKQEEILTYDDKKINFDELINLDKEESKIDPLNDKSVYNNFLKMDENKKEKTNTTINSIDEIVKYSQLPFYKRWFTKKPAINFDELFSLIPPPQPHILKTITTKDILDEITLHILGLERNRKLNIENKNIIAYHEAGHALMAFILKDGDIPTKICISVVSDSLGYTMHIPDEDDLLLRGTSNKLIARLLVLYSGRIAETHYLDNNYTSGGSNDYQKAKEILKKLVLTGLLNPAHNYIDHMKEYEPTILNKDLEIIVTRMNIMLINKTRELLNTHKDELKQIAELIIEKNSINDDDIRTIYTLGQYYDVTQIKNDMSNLLDTLNK